MHTRTGMFDYYHYNLKIVATIVGLGPILQANVLHNHFIRHITAICRMDSVDPSGSGDAFAAGVITGILHRWDMSDILRYAAALGASATTAIGTTDGVFTASTAQSYLDKTRIRVTHFTQDE